MSAIYTVQKSANALAAATAETLLHVGAGVRVRLLEWGVSFDGVTASDVPVLVQVITQTTAGTGTTATPVPRDPAITLAAQSVARHSFSAEPTLGDILESHYVSPNGGLLVMQYPPGQEPVSAGGAAEYIGIRATAPTSAVNASVWFAFIEE